MKEGLHTTSALAIAGHDVHFISFLFAIGLQFWAENYLLSNRIKISTFCSFTGQTFQQKVINCPAIANASTLAAIQNENFLQIHRTNLLYFF